MTTQNNNLAPKFNEMNIISSNELDSLSYNERQKACVFNEDDIQKILLHLQFKVSELQKQYFFFNTKTEVLSCTGWVNQDNLSYSEKGIVEVLRWNDYKQNNESFALGILDSLAKACKQQGFTPLYVK
jgi:hypothetical protein